MKLFFYIPSLKSGGAEKQCTLIAAGLKESFGYDVEIVMTHAPDKNNANDDNFKRVSIANIPIHILAWYRFLDVFRMFKLFRSNRDSIVFCYMTFPNFFGGFIGWLAGVRSVYGGVRTDRLPFRFMLMEYIAHYLWTKGTIFNSRRACERFIGKGFLRKRSYLITNAIESGCYVQTHAKIPDKIQIITVGTFCEAKDYWTWLNVIRENLDFERNIEAVIIGYGTLESRIKEWIVELKLGQIVRLIPGNHGIGIPDELAKADVYLNTSIREGTSNSLMEAMRAGLPVVATDVGDNARLITEGFNGFIAPPRDVESLSKKLSKLIADQKLRRQFGIRSRERIEKCYSVYNIVSEYKKIIERG